MKFLEKALIFFIDFIFPQCCLICGKITKQTLCKNCKRNILKKAIFKIETINNEECYYEKHIYIFNYKDNVRNLILDYKFHDKSYLYKLFSEIIIKNEKLYGILKKYDIIVSVPIHKIRKKQRGYNQSELIAREIAKKIQNLKYENSILQKRINTIPQSSLNKERRKENAKNVYKIISKEKIFNKKVILFDDIYTTGNTVNECSKILKENGAKEVIVLTIAKD